jgi:histidinol-phosphatase (PHP family)
LLEKVKEYGGKLLLGSDSHDPRNLDFFFDESVKILKSIGFETISVFNGKEFEDVKI